MSQSEKAAFYRAVKEAGVPMTKHYREYSTEELRQAHARLVEAGAAPPLTAADLEPPSAAAPQRAAQPSAPVRQADPSEMAGQRLNTSDDLVPIRTDPETGFVWYQEEVKKASYAKPRGRRVLDYIETGTEEVSVQNGEYIETFEVAGQKPGRPAQVKITLPSYQVGIYKDPRFPFRIHTYNGNQGFDLFEVQNYYGGAELVPAEVKRVYVENVLCYDIRTVVRAIQTEFRQLQLAGKI